MRFGSVSRGGLGFDGRIVGGIRFLAETDSIWDLIRINGNLFSLADSQITSQPLGCGAK